jgi:ElaA protein
MEPEWKIRRFNELSLIELYQLLLLRSEVFVVEQNCVYQDIDDKDPYAIHLFFEDNGQIQAYARLFAPGAYFSRASIGRVVVRQRLRRTGLGHLLMHKAVEVVAVELEQTEIEISAQLYLKDFYELHGFLVIGTTYLEDDIPHIKMIRS